MSGVMDRIQGQGLVISGLSKTFAIDNDNVQALKDINLSVGHREFVSIVGVSGCGKSTLLRIVAGLETCEEGDIESDGMKINAPGNDRGMIFQESRLFPWLNVADNVVFGINEEKQSKLTKKEKNNLVNEYLKLVGLDNFAGAYPHQLSGGMQQRVSIVRALIENPKILLLDEPFGALDALTRIHMQKEILRIWEQSQMTMLLVTHDIDEAIYLGDRVIVLSSRPGTIKREVKVNLPRPRNRSSIDFVRIRKSIMQEFFEEHEMEEDFTI
jgi:sulfonate transport system ATP-binding protein